jgi:hypothetical protein
VKFQVLSAVVVMSGILAAFFSFISEELVPFIFPEEQ